MACHVHAIVDKVGQRGLMDRVGQVARRRGRLTQVLLLLLLLTHGD